MNVLIIGAGPCGLTAAWELSKKGIPVTVIEQDKAVGGLCKSVRRKGYNFDLGGHRFISKDNDLIEDVKALMKDELLTRTRKSVIRFKNKEYCYPINIKNVLTNSSCFQSLKFLTGYIASKTGISKYEGAAGSFEAWIDKRFGKALNNFFFKPYTEKLWGIPSSQLSDEWAVQRISLPDFLSAFLQALNISNSPKPVYALKYLYPKNGIGELFEMMAEDIRRVGGNVFTGITPLKFEFSDKTVSGIWTEDSNRKKILFESDFVLSTIPLKSLLPLLGYDSNIFPLKYRSLRFMNIFLSIENLSQNTWMYVPEQDMIMTRIQEPKRRSPFNAPAGKTSVMVEIPCDKGDNIWRMNDEELLKRVLKDLGMLGFEISKYVTGYFSTWAEHAYPCYELGYQKNLNGIMNIVSRYNNLTTLGRQGLFRYIFMDTAMLMGRKWACNLLSNEKECDLHNLDNDSICLEAQSLVG